MAYSNTAFLPFAGGTSLEAIWSIPLSPVEASSFIMALNVSDDCVGSCASPSATIVSAVRLRLSVCADIVALPSNNAAAMNNIYFFIS